MKIDNKERSASWESIAKEMQSERDASRQDLMRAIEERNAALMEVAQLKETVADLVGKMGELLEELRDPDDWRYE